ncbi:aspartyl/asparaginyl beta-hydroxylase domain-containing protein [Arenibaculum pallidiluteum]|uniref:aspartyl/asparaginyl beta-hydroxylase domain-containing protein n=1 Tax=Arenibaculum pallidiluteum TaxID=2812559 RepID=UPI001A96C74B|nr:aspartyl/asparaginyl beta-hydroxylase domain-containing protein [Arenibaculum pallidiluteum]
MDIGVPYRDLGSIDLEPLLSYVEGLSEEDWSRNPLRQELFADGAHSVTQAIVFKHEWHPGANSVHYAYVEDLIHAWGLQKGIDPSPFMPLEREDTDLGPVYAYPDWFALRAVVEPVVERAIAKLRTPHGVVTRVALVRLQPGGKVKPHVDGQPMAARAHRLHIPLIVPPNVVYLVGERKFSMVRGHVYDFNNRWKHAVRHEGKRPRVNLFVDYYPNPGLAIRPFHELGPMFATTRARRVG